MASNARHNTGFTTPNPHQTHGIKDGTSNTIMFAEYYRIGLSNLGARQFLHGLPVSNVKDRHILASTFARTIGVHVENDPAMLIPAVQKIRDAAARTPLRMDISQKGLAQFLTAQAVTDPQDRKLLAVFVPQMTFGRI